MANATFSIAIDMRTFAGYDFSTILGSSGTGHTSDTEYDWRYSSGFYEIVTGFGFSAGFGTFFPDAGTVTGWNFGISQLLPNPDDPWHPITGNYSYWTFTGLSVPAADFSNAVDGPGSDVAAYMPTMLAGNDTIHGSAYADYLLGYEGRDTLFGNAGGDTLEGNGGNDTLNGGAGADTMIGGLGDDVYIVDNAGDKTIENASEGTDTVKSSVSLALAKNIENLTLTGSAVIDGTGNALQNVITGNDAANLLVGNGGHDILNGGGGNDTLNGGRENDVLTGGSGQDEFLFSTSLNSSTNVDKIKDFSVADDTIGLSSSAFAALTTPGTLAASAFFTGAAAHDADDRIIYDSSTGNLYYDPDGTGPETQILFAHLSSGLAMTSNDFIVI